MISRTISNATWKIEISRHVKKINKRNNLANDLKKNLKRHHLSIRHVKTIIYTKISRLQKVSIDPTLSQHRWQTTRTSSIDSQPLIII